jgi:hypothetical protein
MKWDDSDRITVTIVGSIIFMFLLAIGVGFAQGNKAMFSEKSGFLPERIVVQREMPDDGLICVQPKADNAMLSCRKISELRAWIVQRPAK